MWPWDHLAVGYVAYSLGRRVASRPPPSVGAAIAVLVGSQFPDLVDKPLGWSLGVLPSGVSLAHSLLFALPVCTAVYAWRWRAGAPEQGVAFAVATLLHPVADALYPAVLGQEHKLEILLWPLLPVTHSSPVSVTNHLFHLASQFGAVVLGPRGVAVVGLEVALLATATWLWLADGRPGSRLVSVRRWVPDS